MWTRFSSISVVSNSNIVTINSGSTSHVKVGDALLISGFDLVEIDGVFADQLQLHHVWEQQSLSDVSAVVVPTFGDFNRAVEEIRNLSQTTNNNMAAMEKWWSELGNVIFQSYDGESYQVRTAQQMDADVTALEQRLNSGITAVDKTYVMTEAQSLAIRKQNREFFAANDFVYPGKHYVGSGYYNVNQGLWGTAGAGYENAIMMGRVNGSGHSKTDLPVFNCLGALIKLASINTASNGESQNKLILSPAPDGTVTYNSSTGTVKQHDDPAAAFAAETDDISVVIRQVDLMGLEFNFRRITDDEVFPFCTQNQSSFFGDTDVPTVDSAKPDSYFSVYDGQSSVSKGKCVQWASLSETQKRKVSNYLGESFYVGTDGYLYQCDVTQRSIAGAGNGDWENVDPATGKPLQFDENSPVLSKSNKLPFVASDEKGVFEDGAGAFFYVISTVPRLSQGAFHPSFNPMAAAAFSDGNPWSSTTDTITSTLDCFANAGGNLASGISGRPDGLFYDAIYQSGLGGIVDHRLKFGAWDASGTEQAAVVREEVKNGSYRGREFLQYTEFAVVTEINPDGLGSTYYRIDRDLPYWKCQNRTVKYPFNHGDQLLFYRPSTGELYRSRSYAQSFYDNGRDIGRFWNSDGGLMPEVGDIIISMAAKDNMSGSRPISINSLSITNPLTYVKNIYIGITSDITVEGEFDQIDVIGDPANIIANPHLTEGWLGSWVPVIPSGETTEFQFTRKSLVSAIKQCHTTDSGASWLLASDVPINTETNSRTFTPGSSTVLVCNYTAFANQTKLSTNMAVFHHESGLSPVYASQSSSTKYGAALADSLLGVAMKTPLDRMPYMSQSAIVNFAFTANGLLFTSSSFSQQHSELKLAAPGNDSHAMKVLFHQTSNNKQASLNMIASELIHNGTDWGDDGTMKPSNGTFTNTNGNTCKAAIHKLAKPYGWIK